MAATMRLELRAMGVDAMEGGLPPRADELATLRERMERLEQEVADLRLSSLAVGTKAAPPPRVEMASVSVNALQPSALAFSSAKTKASMDDRIGSQWFSRIGVVALLVATALFLKLAIDKHWLGPVGRIVCGLVSGAAIILWSERFRRQGVTAFSYALKAEGSGVLYLTLWAAFQIYHLLPEPVVLGAMVLVTAWNAYMAWSQEAELLAAYALAGGLLTPQLLATGGNHEVFLFTYLLAIGKTFLFDTRGFSEGYRVVRFLALGVLLMGVSLAYQRDWLRLRQLDESAARRQEETA